MNNPEIHSYQRQLVKSLKASHCITTGQVEKAFLRVPRHLFLPGEALEKVYSDVAIVVRRGAEGQWTSSSSQPAIMAIMLEQLDMRPGQRVLEIGAGTGFNAALIAAIVGRKGRVTTVDIQPDLVAEAQRRLDEAGFGHVRAAAGDGGYGYPDGAPYDRIILSVSSAAVAPAWREQLVEGGRLVLPLALPGGQKSAAFEKRGDVLVSVSLSGCGFMPLQGAFAPPQPVRTPVGDDPRLFLALDRALPDEAIALAAWLPAPVKDWPSGVRLTRFQLEGDFLAWLALRDPGWWAGLVAAGDMADRGLVPPLTGVGGEWKSMNSVVFIPPEGGGMAALMREPGKEAPLIDVNRLSEDNRPFELYVRQYGEGSAAVELVLHRLREWEKAGRPSSDDWAIRVYPAEREVAPAEGEYLLSQDWGKMVMGYGRKVTSNG
jgi:protein-L-isoaspartate(D-aspartate) O-methyltransferase